MTFPYVLYTNHKNERFSADMQRQKVTWPCNYRSDFFNFFFKDAQDSKEKVSERRGAIHMRSLTIRKIVEGGGHNGPPPGLIRVKGDASREPFN